MTENLLLHVLPERERSRIEAFCETVTLRPRETLGAADALLEYAWFPHSGACSNLIHVQTGEAVDVAMVGREGMIGVPLVLSGDVNPFHVVVQAGGTATRIGREYFTRDVLSAGHPFCGALQKYANLYLATVAQTAACNRMHRIEQRLARWILDMRVRLDGPVLPITHEMLGLMVGAYRPSVTNALSALQERGVLEVGRGQITIIDQPELESQACECHAAIRERTESTLEQIRSMAA